MTSCFSVRHLLLVVLCRALLVSLTSLSYSPPIQGARSTINFHSIPLLVEKSVTLSLVITFFQMSSSTFLAVLKYFALPDNICFGLPHLAINLRRKSRNFSVVISSASSRWIALTAKQVNRHIQTFFMVGDSTCVI